jgi:hypothetical protein
MGTVPSPPPIPANQSYRSLSNQPCPSSPLLVPPASAIPLSEPTIPPPPDLTLPTPLLCSPVLSNPLPSSQTFQPSSEPNTVPLPPRSWNSLFKSKPINAGKFVPREIQLEFSGDAIVPPADVVQAGNDMWSEYLVGFFLDTPLPYATVLYYLKRVWKLKGSISVKSDGFLFLFKFTNEEDRIRISEADPVVMRNKLFIVKPWDANIGNNCSSIKTVPVWIKLSNIPLFAWSTLGINWLASRVGKLLCLDISTEKFERISFAKCLVEVNPNQELPDSFTVQLQNGSVQVVNVTYLWKPQICTVCKEFGHQMSNCKHVENGKNVEKEMMAEKQKKENDGRNIMKKGQNSDKQSNIKQVWQKVIKNKSNSNNSCVNNEEVDLMNQGAKQKSSEDSTGIRSSVIGKDYANQGAVHVTTDTTSNMCTLQHTVMEEQDLSDVQEKEDGKNFEQLKNAEQQSKTTEKTDVHVCAISTSNTFALLQAEVENQETYEVQETEEGEITEQIKCAELHTVLTERTNNSDNPVTSELQEQLEPKENQAPNMKAKKTRESNKQYNTELALVSVSSGITTTEFDNLWSNSFETLIKQIVTTKQNELSPPSSPSHYQFSIPIPGWPTSKQFPDSPTLPPTPPAKRKMQTRSSSLSEQRRKIPPSSQ